jgi:16S rRNA (guanine527-N7)-methyltransferase
MEQDDKIAKYVALLTQYADTLNLISQSALTDIDRKIAESRYFVESIAQYDGQGKTIIDIGSGAGLPGIIIAAMLPEYSVHLVERRKRRANFLKLVVSQLNLSNCTVWGCDVSVVSGPTASYITALAVARFSELYALSCHLHDDVITLISRKGPEYSEEIAELESRIGSSVSWTEVTSLQEHGSLVTIRLPGGVGCQ